MPFTAQNLENAANAALDFHMKKGVVDPQSIQSKPLLKKMLSKRKSFPGGKELITKRLKFDYTTGLTGFADDDQVGYVNPANIKVASYPWFLHHGGIEFTMHEMLKDGISYKDTNSGSGEVRHTKREATALANLIDDKFDDMKEGTERSLNGYVWGDGSLDPKAMIGVRSFILNDPTTAVVVGGIDQGSNALWRNRALLALSTTTPADFVIIKSLQKEMRQLRRYGKGPDCFYAGSDFIDAIEAELYAKGTITQTGWAEKGGIEVTMDDVKIKGMRIEYDPELDDLGLAKYMYAIDSKSIFPMFIEGEFMKKHSPSRPSNQYIFQKAITAVGNMVCWRRNTSGVYSIA